MSSKQDVRATKTEHPPLGTTNQGQAQTNLITKQDNVTIKGLQANVSIPKVKINSFENFPERGQHFGSFTLCIHQTEW